jgi:hypothetical protein
VSKLVVSDGGPSDSFGSSVSLSSNVVAVGAPFATISGKYAIGQFQRSSVIKNDVER